MKLMNRITIIFIVLAIIMVTSTASAQTVRGRIDRMMPNGPQYPAGYVAVTLFSTQMGRSAAAYTTPDGFYFLYNVPPGKYILEVWAYQRPLIYEVMVFNQPLTDIPPITIR